MVASVAGIGTISGGVIASAATRLSVATAAARLTAAARRVDDDDEEPPVASAAWGVMAGASDSTSCAVTSDCSICRISDVTD